MDFVWFPELVAGAGGALLGAFLSRRFFSSRERSLSGVEESDWNGASRTDSIDLMRYPDRLARLERGLDQSCREAESQVRHLKLQRDRVATREGSENLSDRYDADARQLEARQAQLQRVMGLVWRTRSILILRVRIANVARECPRMEDIPHLPDAEADWEAVAVSFLAFRRRVRQSIADVRTAESNIALSLPTVPGRATIEEGERKRVRAELDRALGTLDSIRGRLEKLSDTVGYLADRCRTREVVEAAPVEISAGGDAEEILHDVREALGGIDGLSELADRRLAEDAMDNLASGISQLEREGLDAQAESDAAMEVDRLIEQFPR